DEATHPDATAPRWAGRNGVGDRKRETPGRQRLLASGAGRERGSGSPRGRATGSGHDGRHSVLARVLAVAGLLALIVVAWLLVSVFQPFSGEGRGRVVVEVPKGSSVSRVASILAKDGVIESSFFFDIRTFLTGSGNLKAGTFVLEHGMSYGAAIAALSNAAAARRAVVKIVVPEGQTRAQIAQTARRDGLKGSYMQASRRAPNFPPSHYGAPVSTPNLEGFLFPATYELDRGAPVSELVQQQLVAFSERFSEGAVASAKAMKLTPYQLLIVASMVEREAKLPRDRSLVAAVIYNRLHLGTPLGIDATIRFALNDYEKPLTEAQLHIHSPYNTRTHRGLPPTPISNPGTEAIEAAAHPAHVNYLYYVAGADGCGDLVFSNTYAEFERHSAEYDEALARNGGRVPACKRR
ncbi:MAG: endolytic transglycosylase MltG, partial [Solirubrobacteraceae bacterium]